MSRQTLRLVVSDLFPGDAIGNFVLGVAARMRREGAPCALYAQRRAPSLPVDGDYAAFFRDAEPGDILLYQLSNGDPGFAPLMNSPCRRVVYYHNITPGRFFRPYDAATADLLDKGRAGLPLLAGADAVFANSAWSLAEVSPYLANGASRGVMPPLAAGAAVRPAGEVPAPGHDLPTPYLLNVGRVIPHKNTVGALRTYAALRERMPELSCVVMGGGFGAYEREAREAAAALGAGIRFTGRVDAAEARRLFAQAAGLLCASLHEGFCIPLVEAMESGLPVFAVKQPAVRETLGGAGLLLDGENAAADADLIRAALKDPEALAAMRQKGRARAEALRREAAGNAFWPAIRPGARA
jgi:glycosyltransferase involved in cell wall biosynthesis